MPYKLLVRCVAVSIRMAVNKSKVSAGFIVVGVLTMFFGTVLVFVGPIIIDDQVLKVRSLLKLKLAHLQQVYLFAD